MLDGHALVDTTMTPMITLNLCQRVGIRVIFGICVCVRAS